MHRWQEVITVFLVLVVCGNCVAGYLTQHHFHSNRVQHRIPFRILPSRIVIRKGEREETMAITARKIEKIQAVLSHLYPHPPAPLNYHCAFTFLCAVVMSAQTTDGKVNEVTKELFSLAPTPQAMARLDADTVQNIIRPVGLAPTKARNLVGLAQKLVADFDSTVPDTYEELESLPGVGHKTASVIMSHVYGVPAFAVDTHVHRLALRWGLCTRKDESDVNKVQADLMKHFPPAVWGLVRVIVNV
jgi:endonuclease-3